MRCPSCHSDNRDSAKFCDECGAKLTATRVPSAPRSLGRRLAAVDWLLLGVLLPICVFGIVMNVIHGAVAIDDATFCRAGQETCAAFVRHADLVIRGRAQPETVYALRP